MPISIEDSGTDCDFVVMAVNIVDSLTLESAEVIIVPHQIKLAHWPLMGGLLHLVYSEEGTGWGPSPPSPLLAVPNVTAHPSTASVPITVLLHDGPLLCGFNVPMKG